MNPLVFRGFRMLGYGALGIALFFCMRYVLTTRAGEFIPKDSSGPLTPPTDARVGILSFSEGAVTHLVRGTNNFTEATPGGTIRQGESIATAMGTASISIPDIGTLEIGDHTEISFANLIPDAPVFFQTYGTVRYSAETVPVSVRMLHSVLTGQGSAVLTYENFIAQIDIESGSFTVGIIDPQNTTHTYTGTAGQTMYVNDMERSVTIK